LRGDKVWRYDDGRRSSPAYPSDINVISVGLELVPGADVVVEVDEIRVDEKEE